MGNDLLPNIAANGFHFSPHALEYSGKRGKSLSSCVENLAVAAPFWKSATASCRETARNSARLHREEAAAHRPAAISAIGTGKAAAFSCRMGPGMVE